MRLRQICSLNLRRPTVLNFYYNLRYSYRIFKWFKRLFKSDIIRNVNMYINYCVLVTLYILYYACVYFFLFLYHVHMVVGAGSHVVGQYTMRRYADRVRRGYYRAVFNFSLLCESLVRYYQPKLYCSLVYYFIFVVCVTILLSLLRLLIAAVATTVTSLRRSP